MKEIKLYSSLLYLYPESYRKEYGSEMVRVFKEMYMEEKGQGKTGIFFWSKIIRDITVSGIEEHLDDLGKRGPKNYLGKTLKINGLNILGAILLLPYAILFSVDFTGRLIQGDFTRYNRTFYGYVSHSFVYTHPPLLWFILILAPFLAIAVNLFPFMKTIAQDRGNLTLKKLFFANPFAAVIVALGFGALLIVFGHDVIPCTVRGTLSHGLADFFRAADYCRLNA